MKVVILGSDGFVGKNLLEDLARDFDCYGSSRRKERNEAHTNVIYFNLQEGASWKNIIELEPDCIINCIVSGVINNGEEIKHAIDVNYLLTIKFYKYIAHYLPGIYLVHFGTAFEYDLELELLTEESICIPKTYYGISKLLASNFLLDSKVFRNFTIIRPFNIFGPHDKENKIIPYLIAAQREKKIIMLSEGLQKRDYFFVKDLSLLVKNLINKTFQRVNVMNAGSGNAIVLKEVAKSISHYISNFDACLWQWGKIPYRDGETPSYYNGSGKLKESGTLLTNFEKGIEATVAFYYNYEKKEPIKI